MSVREDPAPDETAEAVEPPDLVEPVDDGRAALEKEVAELTARLRTVSAAYKNLQDDMNAFKTRVERQLNVREEMLRGDAVSALFEPLENLRRAVEALRPSGDPGVIQGLEAVIASFLDGFQRLGLEEYGQPGDRFDPSLHEALTTVGVPEEHDGRVIEVFTRGYRVGNRVIRAARVVVGQFVPVAGEA